MEDPEEKSPRRSTRNRKLSLKALETASYSPKKSRGRKKISETEESSEDSDEEFNEKRERPSVLHDEQLPGSKLFSFHIRKKCEVVLNSVPKTPHSARNKLKKEIANTMLDDSSEHDFSDSGSEFDANQESESESSDPEESEEEAPKAPKLKSKPLKSVEPVKRATLSCTMKTDNYFENHASKKILTSNHTLDKLETPRLPQDQLQKLLSKVSISDEHQISIENLKINNESHFNKWMLLMHEEFNIILYGLGSKKDILDSFHEKCLKKLPSVVVHGFFPSLSIKDVLDGIIVDILELKENPVNALEACELIEKEFSYIPNTHIYLVVHNIEMMRTGKAQSVLARLASVRNIHLITSIDHINAPLIWDQSKLSKFNFTWWDVTSFQSYTTETSFESSMMVQRSGTLALSSLRNVFLSLTSNSKGIYLILVKYQIENGKKQYYQGLSFKELYSLCREAFLVSSDLALRAQMTEFVDHKMAKYKRSPDGTENLIIPIPNTVLQQFLSEQSS